MSNANAGARTKARADKIATHLPQDPTLPGLAVAVDGEQMARHLQRALFGDGGQFKIKDCKIARVKYAFRKRCTIGYELIIRDAACDRTHQHFLSARLFEQGASDERFQRYSKNALPKTRFGHPLLHLKSLGMIAWSFPFDRHLPALPLLTDEARLRHDVLPRLVETHWGPDWYIVAARAQLASYVHERRCCMRVQLQIENRLRRHQAWTIFGKTAGAHADGAIDAASRFFWNSGERRAGQFSMSRPLGACPDEQIVWQDHVAGLPLAVTSEPLGLNAFAAAGNAVANLHAMAPSSLPQTDPEAALTRLHERVQTLCAGWPHLRSRLLALLARLSTQSASAPVTNQRVVHGDLHCRNILIDGNTVTLIDLDEARLGSPAQDLGHFIAYALWEERAAGRALPAIDAALAAFLIGYRHADCGCIDPAHIAWHAAAALLSEKVFRAVTAMQDSDGSMVNQGLDLAETLAFSGTEIGFFTVAPSPALWVTT